MKKIEDIKDIWDGKNLLIKDFTDYDLSNIDLSVIPCSSWIGCFFSNTNFANTNIKFNPSELKYFYKYDWTNDPKFRYTSIANCNFENCDLTYLRNENLANVDISGCNFKNTGLKVDIHVTKYAKTSIREKDGYRIIEIYVSGVIFDEFYAKCNTDYWEDIYFDIETLLKNPHLHISSAKLANIIFEVLPSDAQLITPAQMKYWVSRCEEYLKLDKDKHLYNLYFSLKPRLSLFKCYQFFQKRIEDIDLTNFDFKEIPANLFGLYSYANSLFENTIIGTNFSSITNIPPEARYIQPKVNSVCLPTVNYNSWREKNENRIRNTPITFRTNVYVELDRVCNANCVFCRNNSYNNCRYSLNNIQQSLLAIYPYIDDIVIGGGEPTLRCGDLKKLRSYIVSKIKIDIPNWYIFTNGSKDLEDIESLKSFQCLNVEQGKQYTPFYFNISRHAVEDQTNADIFRVSKDLLYSTNELEWIATNTTSSTLCATCIKGGLDSFEKILEYIIFAQQLGYSRVLLSTLHKDISAGDKVFIPNELNIDENIFSEVIAYLERAMNLKKKQPICSSGGYTSTVLTTNNYSRSFTVAFKDYISKEELSNIWPSATKRTFDLSIDPSGNVYENWHQTSGLVKIKELTRKSNHD